MRAPDEDFPPSPTIERVRNISSWPVGEDYAVLDVTFSDANRYPSLREFEVCSDLVARGGNGGRDVYKRLRVGEYLPRLRALGRLPA